MIGTALFRIVIATYGYQRLYSEKHGIFERKEQTEDILANAPGRIIENTIGLGWAKQWRVVVAGIEEHDDERGVVVAGCVPAEEQG